VLLARPAGTRIVAANFCRRSHERLARMMMVVIVSVIAVRPMYVFMVAVLMENGVGLAFKCLALVHGWSRL
jgi:hypothetical protein